MGALDLAPVGPARCALVLIQVWRRIDDIERGALLLHAAVLRGHFPSVKSMRRARLAFDQLPRLYLAAEILEAALRWHQESLYTAVLETFDAR